MREGRVGLATIHQEGRSLSIPLMTKKLNSMEKYLQSYKTMERQSVEKSRVDNESRFSLSGERVVYGGRFTPDPSRLLPTDSKCFVKYSPVKDEKTEEKLEILNKLEVQYSNLKYNLNTAKEPFTSKYTVPLSRQKRAEGISPEAGSKANHSVKVIEKQLRKETLMEEGKKQFLDLYIMKKERAKLKEEIQKNHKFVIEEDVKDKNKEHEQFLIDKRQRETEDKKNKMLVNKGLHWNVYYQMLALTNLEKERLKGGNSSFVATYGIE